MKEERLEILKMLKEGIVTPEQAERLLTALEEGERRTGDSRERRRRPAHRFGPDPSAFAPLRELARSFGGFGKSLGTTMQSSFNGLAAEEFQDLAGYEDIPLDSEGIALSDGATLSIVQPRGASIGGDVAVTRSPSGTLTVETDGRVQLRRKGDAYALICDEDCTVAVPDDCASVTLGLFNGDILVRDLMVPLTASTMNGDIELDGVALERGCSTLSGDVSVSVRSLEGENIEITTMSGDIQLELPSDWNGVIDANTMSGDVDVTFPGAQVENRSGIVGSKFRARLGSDPATASIRLASMSGDIAVEPNAKREMTHADTE